MGLSKKKLKNLFEICKQFDGTDESCDAIEKIIIDKGYAIYHTEKQEGMEFFTKVMEYLNQVKGGKPFPIIFSSQARTLILNLKNKNFTLGEIKSVIDLKSKQWRGTDSWQYFRWKTLFNETNFLNYIAQDGPIKRSGENAFSEFAHAVGAAQGTVPSDSQSAADR